jgi:hypothetical protein
MRERSGWIVEERSRVATRDGARDGAQLCGTYLSTRSNSIPRATASVARSAVIVSAALTRIVRACRVRSRTDLSTRGHVQKLLLGRAAEIRPTNVKFIV